LGLVLNCVLSPRRRRRPELAFSVVSFCCNLFKSHD